MAKLSYRPEIDSLRALAVLPVVFFHAGVPGFPGGYVGVDVFFVISGYLITSILLNDIEAERFSLIAFYERRARRILPALFAVILISGIGAFFLLPASAFEDFSRSVLATSFFASNVYFWQATDYFSTSAEYRILLHTWSLAVEEQFYVLWPLLLFLIAQRSRACLLIAVATVLGLSLCASILAIDGFEKAGFYLLPTRAWELMIGAALALREIPSLPGRLLNSLAALAGLAMILIAIVGFNDSIAFPGAAALLPCLGAALVIHAGGEHHLAKPLAWRPLVLLGLMSYSLYLWHWPVLVFLRLGYGTVELPLEIAAIAILLSLLLAYLSWRLIERPFRRKNQVSRRGVFACASTAAALCMVLSTAGIAASGFPSQVPQELHFAEVKDSETERTRKACMGRLPSEDLCRIGALQERTTVLLWGDSHASSMMWAIDTALKAVGKSAVVASQIACPPLLGVRRDDWSWRDCVVFNEAYLSAIESGNTGIETVVLSARWALAATGQRAEGEAGEDIQLVEMNGDLGPGTTALFARGLGELVTRLRRAGIRVVILGGVPEIGWDVPATLALRAKLGLAAPDAPSLSEIEARNAEADAIITEIAAREGIDYIPIAPLLCQPVCQVYDGTGLLYVDDDHLSAYGAGQILGKALSSEAWP